MDNKIILSSMAMDLKRAALGWHHHSNIMAEKFYMEALKRKKEINKKPLSTYLKRIFVNIEQNIKISDYNLKAERALMYSTLVQNYALSLKMTSSLFPDTSTRGNQQKND